MTQPNDESNDRRRRQGPRVVRAGADDDREGAGRGAL